LKHVGPHPHQRFETLSGDKRPIILFAGTPRYGQISRHGTNLGNPA
jgi:hypothetical protein